MSSYLGIEQLTSCVKNVKGADDTMVDKLIALGVISVLDLDDVGAEPLVSELDISKDVAGELVEAAVEEAKRLAAESKQKQAEKELAQQEEVTE